MIHMVKSTYSDRQFYFFGRELSIINEITALRDQPMMSFVTFCCIIMMVMLMQDARHMLKQYYSFTADLVYEIMHADNIVTFLR